MAIVEIGEGGWTDIWWTVGAGREDLDARAVSDSLKDIPGSVLAGIGLEEGGKTVQGDGCKVDVRDGSFCEFLTAGSKV